MQKQAGIMDRITVPTRIIVNRVQLTAAALAETLQSGELASAEAPICELEAGGQVLARGRIVKRRGKYWFEAVEVAEGGKQ